MAARSDGWTRRGALVAAASSGAFVSGAAAPRSRPIVIAHRGASGERPEHTLAAYKLAIAHGADFIEPDLVVTKDGVLVCRHEPEIGATTDVATRPEFAARRTSKTLDGQPTEGWFVEDFTLAELKTLRCRERIPQLRPGNTAYDGQEAIPTLQEAIDLAKAAKVGVYCELKHPTDLRARGHDTVPMLVQAFKRNGLNGRRAPAFFQCFEVEPAKRFRELSKTRVVQLVVAAGGPYDAAAAGRATTYKDMLTAEGLRALARYADGLGAEKSLILPRDAAGRSLPPTRLVADAHAAGLLVHTWTFRSENIFLPAELRRGDPSQVAARGDAGPEYEMAFAAGVDGVFADHPADAVAARNRFAPARL
jgi:glycerophosphoryl diester phosphodiesterase